MAGMRHAPDRSLLRQDPARVQVTDRAGSSRWLADPPHGSVGDGSWWSLTDDLHAAGVWPWSEALELTRATHQPWRRQTAQAVAVAERWAAGPEARVRAAGMGLEDAAAVRCIVMGPERVLVLRAGGREWLPAIAAVAAG